jgi:hypothetical protein
LVVAEANARLLACAQDLLTALQQLLASTLETEHDAMPEAWYKSVDVSKNVIRRASGKANTP